MKKILVCFFFSILALSLNAEELHHKRSESGILCRVRICNKLERFTLSIWKMMKDNMGETCWEAVVPKEEAVQGKILTSESRWYQGSINPTKKSVTRIASVGECSTPEVMFSKKEETKNEH